MAEQEKYGMEQLAEYLDMRIRYEEKIIKENRNKLDRDYLYYFVWTGEELFKSHFMVKQYGELRLIIRQVEAPGSLCKNLRRYIELSFIFRIFMERN